MNSLPKITIVTPTFNQAAFIEQTISSVLDQGYPNLEYIIIDGGSTDGTLDILKKYDGRLFWISEKDRGQSHALNKGLARATGEILAFINSDDVYEPGAFHKVGEFFITHPNAFWLTGRCRVIDTQGKEIRKAVTFYKNIWLTFGSYKVLQILDYVSQPATFWRKYVVNAVGPFNESLRYAMDYDYSLRIGQRYRLWAIPGYLARYRIHPTSKAGSSAKAQFDAEMEILRLNRVPRTATWLHQAHNALIVAVYRCLQ